VILHLKYSDCIPCIVYQHKLCATTVHE